MYRTCKGNITSFNSNCKRSKTEQPIAIKYLKTSVRSPKSTSQISIFTTIVVMAKKQLIFQSQAWAIFSQPLYYHFLVRHGFSSSNNVRSSYTTTTYNNSAFCNTTTIRIKDVGFLINSLRSLAIECIGLLAESEVLRYWVQIL